MAPLKKQKLNEFKQRNLLNSKLQNKIIQKKILLKNMNKHSWIWVGVSEKDEFLSEEPVVLDFDDKKFYFYSKGIKKKDYLQNTSLVKEYKNLNYNQQEELLKAFAKQTDHKYENKSTLLKMKANFLNTIADVLHENLDKRVVF